MNLLLHVPPHHHAFALSASLPPLPSCFSPSPNPRSLPFAIAFLSEKPPSEPRLLPPHSPSPPCQTPHLSNAASPPSCAATRLGLTDTSLQSTWVHRIWIGAGFAAMGGMILKAAGSVDSIHGVGLSVFGVACGYVLADLSTGIYHWGVDNYGDAKSPIFGAQIDAFQGHHRRPWTITKRQFANNIHALARPAFFSLLPFLLLPSYSVLDSFLGSFLAFVVLSQQFHSWAHCKKKDLPVIVLKLQDTGLLISRKMHGTHHRFPYDINYCIVNGMWNPLLDRTNFFGKLELFIFTRWGVKPRSWSETAPEWLQEGSYFADGTDLDSRLNQ